MMDASPDHRSWARLDALVRPDKWYLSGGDGLLWAPPFPRFLHRPGFWDEARLYHFALEPCFAVGLVQADGTEEALTREGLQWRPDRLRLRWRSESGLSFTETRFLLPGGRLCSAWRTDEDLGWPNPVFQHRFLAAWTAVPTRELDDLGREENGLAWGRRLRDDLGGELAVDQALTALLLPPRGHHRVDAEARADLLHAATRAWVAAARCEGPVPGGGPAWALTPFAEGFAVRDGEGRPPWPDLENGPDGDRGDTVHLAAVLPLAELPARHAVAFEMRVLPRTRAAGDRAPGPAPLPRPRLARDRWARDFEAFPRFRCSDGLLTAHFDYRVYGLHLNRLAGGRDHLPFPAVAEGVGPLHHPTAASAPCHMMEARWAVDPDLARGTLLNFLAHQREDGSLPASLYIHRPPDDAVCHLNWGDAVRAVHRLHPQRTFLERAYGALARYGTWMARVHDPDESGLLTLRRPQEVGQDHTPRWEAATGPELKPVDASVCALRLWGSLAEMAEALGYDEEAVGWEERRKRSGEALARLWDDEAGIYRDLDPATVSLTDVASSAGFRPLLTDVPDEGRVHRLLDHLEPGGSFHGAAGLPTLAVDDPRFDAGGFWKGRRRNRPFNGRAWPAATCQVLEGLLRQWHRGVARAGPLAARLLGTLTSTMCAVREPPRPDSFEHYNPFTGHPSRFRGLDDHQRSWILDLLVRGVAGVEPLPEGLLIHPLPVEVETVELEATLRGRPVQVSRKGATIEVEVDGARHRTTVGEPLEIPW